MLKLSARNLLRSLLLVALVLCLLHIARRQANVRADFWLRFLSVGQDGSLSAWYAESLLLAGAGLALFIRRREAAQSYAGCWLGLALLLAALAVEYATGLHRRLVDILGAWFGTELYVWAIPLAAAFVLIALAYRRFRAQFSPRIRRLLGIDFGLFAAGYVVIGLVMDWYGALEGRANWRYATLAALEAFTRMSAMSLLIYTLLACVQEAWGDIQLRFGQVKKWIAVLVGVSLFFTVYTFVMNAIEENAGWLQDYDPHNFAFLLDTRQESTIPTLFSVGLLLCAALLLVLVWAGQGRGVRFRRRWLALAAIFVFLSLDEAASIHEATIQPLREVLQRFSIDASGFLYYAWVVPAILLLALLALAYIPFFAHVPRRTRWLFLAAAALFVGGALGLEIVGGYLDEHFGRDSLLKILQESSEEGLEMLGATIFIYALFDYLRRHAPTLAIHFTDSPGQE